MSFQFPNQYLPQGNFTVCYGSAMESIRRVPGTLTVAAANPSYFTTSSASSFTNQDSNVTLTVVGTGLGVKDEIFMLTSIGYTCHDIRKGEFQGNDTLREWFKPSFFPGTLEVNSTGTGVSWVVSNRDRRFNGNILSEPTLCDNPGKNCTMQLCYKRNEATWAPVPIQTPPKVSLLPSDPSSAFFDKYPIAVGMYSSVTVVGRGLSETDVLTVRANTCAGDPVTVSVGTATVNESGTEWIGVVRFIGDGAINYAVCYTRGSFTTEIGNVEADGHPLTFILPELYYLYDADNITQTHEMTQYEELIVGASFVFLKSEGLTAVDLIDENMECNYMPYYTQTGKAPEFTVRLNLVSYVANYFAGRLNIPAGTYALCMQVSVGLFRVTTRTGGGKLTVAAANPVRYTANPALPSPNQQFDLRFYLNGE
ncbi:hemagluttinin family protein, partial [Trypanosoma theileri]